MRMDNSSAKVFNNKINYKSREDRIKDLEKIQKWILQNRQKIKAAIYKDFKKPFEETDISEIYPVIAEIKYAKKNLRKWLKPKKVSKSLALINNSAWIKYEPKGTVLIISPWNYPFMLAIGPLISALAAGNNVVIKPSEISENTSLLIENMINELFKNDHVVVFQGDKTAITQLLKFSFDHIFFTGSTKVGKIIANQASTHLTPLTLELGGKSPLIVDESADLKYAAEKTVWGKFLNNGQTCVAPDYLLIHQNIREELINYLIHFINQYYGKTSKEIEESSSYARIINNKNYNRLKELVYNSVKRGDKIIIGDLPKNEKKFVKPTLVLINDLNSPLLEEEIFGPILPIVEFDNLDNAIKIIHEKAHPLGIYIFSKNKKNIHNITSKTKSGAIGINELVVQFGHTNLPFGGVKESGCGRSHGFYGFKEFSIERSYIKGGYFNFLKIIYPPFTNLKRKIIDFLIKYI